MLPKIADELANGVGSDQVDRGLFCLVRIYVQILSILRYMLRNVF